MESKTPDHIRYTKRWFCYFDLLGFSNLVKGNDIEQVMPLYQKALNHLEKSPDEMRTMGIYVSWFSDTFIIFSRGGKEEDFANIEHVSRVFFQYLILNKIPVRGALTFGDLYSQQERNIFIGPALIDAYCYGEGQDWLGFVLTPSAIVQMEKVGLSVKERFAYRQVRTSGVLKPGIVGPVFAFAFNNGLVSGKNPYINAMKKMKANAGSKHEAKYGRTLKFISSST
ncbi:hypothetical protein [Methylophaga sp.]|uniref:hypothetical protein n=1 Tax=Methylophaga sp. TaxID=2024840 RepID=UPI0025E01E88|nr:hypothetical protein [Methylophaga sp.]